MDRTRKLKVLRSLYTVIHVSTDNNIHFFYSVTLLKS